MSGACQHSTVWSCDSQDDQSQQPKAEEIESEGFETLLTVY